MPVQETVHITGVPKLEEYLKHNDNKYVKLDKFRGDTESFFSKNFDAVELHIDELEITIGPFREQFEFMVESGIDGAEPGFDLFFNGKDWIKPYLWGVELGKTNYIGKWVEELPKPLQLIADKYKPLLQSIDYRGALSIEVRVTKDGTPYLIDTCSRFPAPLATAYPLAIKNYGEVIWKVANGEDVRIENNGRYFAASPISSPHGQTHFLKLDFPEKDSKYIKTYTSAKVDGKYFGIKGEQIAFVLVDAGDDYFKLIEHIKELSKEIDTYMLDTSVVSGLDEITEKVKDYPKYNMGTF